MQILFYINFFIFFSAEENYYSPNISAKSFRDSSILSDSSMTKCIRGPRPRPGLRRSSLISQASSDYISQKNTSSDNTTLNVSALVSLQKELNRIK